LLTQRTGLRRLLVGAAALLASCTGGGAEEPPPAVSSPPPEALIDWSDRPTASVALKGEFSAVACPGEGPFLCIESRGEQVGQIEYLSFPAEQDGGAEELRSRIEDDYRGFEADREGCAGGFEVETEEPEEAEVAGGEGLRSEYAVVDAEGETVERYIKYWSSSGGRIHLLSAEAQEAASCSPSEGAPFSSPVLEDFGESFELVAEASRFPES